MADICLSKRPGPVRAIWDLSVVKADNKKIGSGRPGKITKILMEEFGRFIKNY